MESKNTIRLHVKGMHCRSCEILISEKLKELDGVHRVEVSYKNSTVEVHSDLPLSTEKIRQAIRAVGYDLGEGGQKSWITRNPREYVLFGYALLVFLFLYFLFRISDIRIDTNISTDSFSLALPILVGLAAGVSTCMALVGGLVLGISGRFAEKHPDATPMQKFRPHLFFNLGRILGFALLGGILGGLGSAFHLSIGTLGSLTIGVGIVMLFLGLQLIEIFPRVSSARFTLPSSLSNFFGIKKSEKREYSHANSMLVGALTFFLPCGFTQAMQLAAVGAGNFFTGAAIMGLFALGTALGLLGIGGITSVVRGTFAKLFFKVVGILVIALAFFNISNGTSLLGLDLSFKNDASVSQEFDPNVTLENGIQIVRMDQVAHGYSPDHFVIKKGVPVKWIINSKEPSCAVSIVFREYNIAKVLNKGENVIEFTPTETGDQRFTCGMGMYSGSFTVQD